MPPTQGLAFGGGRMDGEVLQAEWAEVDDLFATRRPLDVGLALVAKP